MKTSLNNPKGALLSVLSVSAFLLSYNTLFPFGEQPVDALLIHGGGAGLVTCSDGSTFTSNISYTALSANGTIMGNWTL